MARDYEVLYKAIADFSSLEKAAKKAERRLESLKKQANDFDAQFQSSQDANADALDGVAAAHDDADDALRKFCADMAKCSETAKGHAQALGDDADAARGARDQIDLLEDALRDHEAATSASTRATEDSTSARRDNTREVGRNADATDDDTSSKRANASALDRLFGGLKRLSMALRGSRSDTDDNDRSSKRFGQTISGLIGKMANLGRAFASFAKFGVIASVLGQIAGALNAVAAAAVVAVGTLKSLSGVLVGIPALLATILLPIGGLVAGFAGLGDAIGAVTEQQRLAEAQTSSTGAAAEAAARQQADAARTVARAREAAARQVEMSERNLRDAQENAIDAQENLNLAREAAVEYLDALEDRLNRQPLLEDRAALNVDIARNELLQTIADPGSTALERRDAEIALAEAEQDLQDLQAEGVEVEEALTEAREDGVEGADFVIAAQEALAQAIEGVADAEYALAEAQENQAEANRQTADSLTDLASAQEKVDEAFRDLSPEAQAFATFIAGLRPKLIEFRQAVQANLLPPLQRAISQAVDVLFPTLLAGFADIAEGMGEVFEDLGDRLTDPSSVRAFEGMFALVADVMPTFGMAINRFLQAMLELAAAGRPLLEWIADVAERWSAMFLAFSQDTDRITRIQRDAIDAFQQWGRILSNLWVTLRGIFGATAEASDEMLERIEETTRRWSEWTNSIAGQNAIRDWADAAMPVFYEIVGLVGDLLRAFVRIAEASDALGFIQRLRDDVVPAIESLLTAISGEFTDAFIDLAVAAMELITTLTANGGALNVFLQTLGGIVSAVNFLLTDIPGVSSALSGLVSALGMVAGFAGALGLILSPFRRLAGLVNTLTGGSAGTGLLGRLSGWFTRTFPAAAATARAAMSAFFTFAVGGSAAVAGALTAVLAAAVVVGTIRFNQLRGRAEEAVDAIVAGSANSADALGSLADEVVSLSEDMTNLQPEGPVLWGQENFTQTGQEIDAIKRRVEELVNSPDLEEAISSPEGRQAILDGYNAIQARIDSLTGYIDTNSTRVLGMETNSSVAAAERELADLLDVQDSLGGAVDQAIAQQNLYNTELRALTEEVGQGTTPGMVMFSQSVADAAEEVGLSESVLRSLIDSGLTPAEVAATDFEQAELDLASAAEEAAAQFRDQATALTELTDPVFRAQEAQQRLTEARAEYARLQAEDGTEAEVEAALGRVIQASGNARSALLELGNTDLSTLNATLNEQVSLNLITEEEKAEFLAGISGENGIVPQAAAALGEISNIDPAVLPGVDNSALLESINQTGEAVRSAVGSWWNGQFVRDSWMSGAVTDAEETGEDVLSATNPWLQQVTDQFDTTRDSVVATTEDLGREVTSEWGDITTTVFRRIEGHSSDVQTAHTDMHDGVERVTATGLNDVANLWRRHPGDVAAPVNATIAGPLNQGVIGSFNILAGFTGGEQMSTLPLVSVPAFNRGGVYEDPRYGTSGPNKDTGLAALTPGEGIVNRDATRANRPVIDAMNNGAVFSMADTESTAMQGKNGPERFAGVAQGVADGRGFNTSGLQKGRTNADKYDLAHARGNNPYASTANPGYLEGADHQGEGYSSRGFGGVKPWVAKAGHFINEMFNPTSIGGVGSRPNKSDHPTGHALDVMVYDDAAKGDAVAEYMAANAGHFAVKYIIWWQHINSGNGWKPMADRGSATANHFDHPHISFLPRATYDSDASFDSVLKGTDEQFMGSGNGMGMTAFTEALDQIAQWREITLLRLEGAEAGTWDMVSASMGAQSLDMAEDYINAQRGALYGNWNGESGVEQWRGVVMQALDVMNLPGSLAGSTLRRMNQESSGNPGIVNNWDSNAKKGTPSVGLMQVIGPTYDRYKHPEYDRGPYKHGTSIDPMANILSSMRYALARYGSLPAAYDKAGGYDSGGFINKGYNLLYSGLNDPEMVTPVPLMRETFRGELDDFMQGMMTGEGLTAPIRDLAASSTAMREATVMLTEAVVQQTAVTEQIGTQIGQLVVNNPREETVTETLPRVMRRMAYLGG